MKNDTIVLASRLIIYMVGTLLIVHGVILQWGRPSAMIAAGLLTKLLLKRQ